MHGNGELLKTLLENGENELTEFKRILKAKDLLEVRRSKLVAQIKFITAERQGIFAIGIEDLGDKWDIFGLTLEELRASEKILEEICKEAKVTIKAKTRIKTERGYIGVYTLEQAEFKEVVMININLVGRVNAGKSTLIGVLTRGALDNGRGKQRAYLLKHPQEIIKGQTADVHLLFLAFDQSNKPLFFQNPLSIQERIKILEKTKKIVTFFDAPGHQEYSKSMIRSILGSDSQYGLVLIPIDDEYELITKSSPKKTKLDAITREHLLLMIANNVPFIVLLTKYDRATEDMYKVVLSAIQRTLKEVGRVPFIVKSEEDIKIVIREIGNNVIVPMFPISTVSGHNIKMLIDILGRLPQAIPEKLLDAPALAYIDNIYKTIPGTNIVVTGTMVSGLLKAGQEIKVGPDENGSFQVGRIASIEVFNKRVQRVRAGEVFGAEIKKIKTKNIRRGQVIADLDYPLQPIRSFTADIIVTRHPTRILEGYSPVMQCRTIHQSVVVDKIYNKKYLVVGDTAKVKLHFKFRPEIVFVNDKFVLREANTRAIGKISEILS